MLEKRDSIVIDSPSRPYPAVKSPMRAADFLNIVFCGLLFGIVSFFYDEVPAAKYLLLIYASLILFQILLIPLKEKNRALSLIHNILFPVLCVLIIFDSLGLVVPAINPQDMDSLLIQWDYRLFGAHPTLFFEKLIHPLITDILQVAYSTYYFLPIVLGVALLRKGQREQFDKALFFILLCFYLSYIGYMLVPALGPRYAMAHLYQKELGGFLLSQPIQDILNLLEGVKRDAFPSGHTGIALTVLYLAFRYARKVFWILLTPVVLLIIATMYCRYHYVVDVLGGIGLMVATVLLGEVYYIFQTHIEYASPLQKK